MNLFWMETLTIPQAIDPIHELEIPLQIFFALPNSNFNHTEGQKGGGRIHNVQPIRFSL